MGLGVEETRLLARLIPTGVAAVYRRPYDPLMTAAGSARRGLANRTTFFAAAVSQALSQGPVWPEPPHPARPIPPEGDSSARARRQCGTWMHRVRNRTIRRH